MKVSCREILQVQYFLQEVNNVATGEGRDLRGHHTQQQQDQIALAERLCKAL